MEQIKLHAAKRLNHPLTAKAPEASEWWHHLPAEQKKQYIEEHPQSKYADQAIKEGEERESNGEKTKELNPKHREEASTAIRSKSSKIASLLKRTFPLIHAATSGLQNLATGKHLDEEQQEALHELGSVALKVALSSGIGPHAAMVVGRIGVTAVKHAIDHYKEKKEQQPDKGDIETFVDAVADGVEQAKEAPVPKEHAKAGSPYRTAIGKHLKATAKHVVAVLDKSFHHIKPATQGLVALSEGKPLTEEHKKAMKGLGKIALGLTISSLPGGLAAHLAAGAGVVALKHAYKSIQKHPIDPQHVLHSFVESIGEGLEHGLLEAVGGEHGGGE